MARNQTPTILITFIVLSVCAHADHWAYQPPQPLPVPQTNSDWPTNGIDEFVFSRLVEEKLSPSKAASDARLLRRVSLMLTGLPPSVEEVRNYSANPTEPSYERFVDRLLASPRYGERWAQPWLDLARYADSNGYQADQLRDSWAYRDWVIRAINHDMPFDQFTVEQLAGDLLANATLDQKIATGFHRTVPCNVETGVHPEQNRVQQIFDRVNTTGTVFLGTTIECCQCHDHKYDPFSQEDYYGLFAFFNNTPIEVKLKSGVQYDFNGPQIPLPMAEDAKSTRSDLESQLERARKQTTGKDRQDKIAKIEQQLKSLSPSTTLVMVEMESPRETRLLNRGDYLDPGEPVEPHVPSVLHDMDDSLPRNRLGLARWIVDPKNPLLARVTVNRWWSQFFGHGIVSTVEDFGVQSEPPTHPELLDWLASEFVKSGWSRKHIHKLIVMSSTFRQSAGVNDLHLEADPQNRLYGRGPRFRMPAESIRDNALAISGLLTNRIGGQPIMPFQPKNIWRAVGRNAPSWSEAVGENRYRRGVYVIWRRAAPYPSFVNFDAPDRAACVAQRPRTNTALQALTLLNDQAYLEMAIGLGDLASTLEPAEVEKRIAIALQRAILREPTPEELKTLANLYAAELERFNSEPALASEFIRTNFKPKPQSKCSDPGLAAMSIVANVILNLDETVNY